MEKKKSAAHYIFKSKFVRSIFFQIVSVFLLMIVAVVAIVFTSFASDINEGVISDKQKQLDVIEDTLSTRMEEITSIAYNISTDKAFYLEAVADTKYSGYEMSNTLARYLVGNGFIEYLAYYRLSEPGTIYASCGALSFHDFWSSYLSFEGFTEDEFLSRVTSGTNVRLLPPRPRKKRRKIFHLCLRSAAVFKQSAGLRYNVHTLFGGRAASRTASHQLLRRGYSLRLRRRRALPPQQP